MATLPTRLIVGVVALAAGVAGYLAYQAGGEGRAPTASPPQLAAAAFADLNGVQRALGEWRDQIVILNFWATWCGPCREEIPGLIAARTRYRSQGLEVVGIALDSADQVRPFAAELGIDYPLLLGQGDAIALMRHLGNASGALPYTVILDRRGEVAARHLGVVEGNALTKMIGPLIKGPPKAP